MSPCTAGHSSTKPQPLTSAAFFSLSYMDIAGVGGFGGGWGMGPPLLSWALLWAPPLVAAALAGPFAV
jgi:hypothetical protein